jgi:hypothetical protein
MNLAYSPEPLWLPRKVPGRVPENPALFLGGVLVLTRRSAHDASVAELTKKHNG